MSGRNELFGYLGTTLGTIVVLFGLQHWYASYLDVHVIPSEWRDAPVDPALEAVRAAEAQALAGGKVPMEQAKQLLASRGRSLPQVAPRPSDDLSAMSGWVGRKGFAPYQPRTPAAPEPVATDSESELGDAGVGGDASETGVEAPAAPPAAPVEAGQPKTEQVQ